MNDELLLELENLPIDQRSPLEQYRELILRWRRQGRAYRWICRMMKEKCGVAVAYGPLYRFVKKRSRPRKPFNDPPATVVNQQPLITPPVKASPTSSTPTTNPHAEARERMRRLKEEPAPRKAEKLFHYTEQDSIDPLVLIPQTKEEK